MPLSRRTFGQLLMPGAMLIAAEADAGAHPIRSEAGPVSVIDHGARGDGWSDDTAAFVRAIAEAEHSAIRRSVLVPSGRSYRITHPLALTATTMWSDSLGATLHMSELGPGAAGITLSGPTNRMEDRPMLRNLIINGPNHTQALGKSPAEMDGILLGRPHTAAQPALDRVLVTGFRAGIVLAAPDGHITLTGVAANGNYYGVYLRQAHGDTALLNCQFGGNAFAGIAMPATTGLGGGCYALMCTLGFQPYGIYQEPGDCRVPFLSDAFLQARFEAIGNGAIVSDATGQGEGGKFAAARIFAAGFSWSDAHRLTSHPRDFCLRFPYADGINIIEQGEFPFLPGDAGLIRCNGTGSFEIVYSGRAQPHPADRLFEGAPEIARASRVRSKGQSQFEIEIAAGARAASCLIQTNLFAFSSEAILASVCALTDPGGRWWLMRSRDGDHTRFTLTLAEPAPAPARFLIALRSG